MPGPFDNLDQELTEEQKAKAKANGLHNRGGDVEVDLTEDPDDDEPEVQGKQLTPKEIRSRERYQANKSAAEENKRKADELEVRLRETEQRAARAEGAALAAQRMQPQTPQKDPIDDQIAGKQREFNRLHQLFEARKATATAAEIQEWQQEATRIKDEEEELKYQKRRNREGGGQRPVNVDAIANEVRFKTAYPDIVARKGNMAVADDIYDDLVRAGAPMGIDTALKAAEQARKKLGLSSRPAPTDAEKNKYRGARAGVQGGGDDGDKGGRVSLSEADQKLAFARFGKQTGGDQAKANKLYAQRIIPRIRANAGG